MEPPIELPAPRLDALAGGIAHDLNSLLIVIMAGAEELATETDLASIRRSATEIEGAAERAAQLTDRLLTACSRRQRTARAVDLNLAVERLVALLRRLIPDPIEVDVALGERSVVAWADPSDVDQVLINLTLNARDALDGNGILSLRTGAIGLDEDDAELGLAAGPYVYISVTDTGTGMTPDTLARIFEPSFTTKPDGTGLGLATVQGVVSAAGGAVRVESEPGWGSTFLVYLPSAAGALA